PELSRQCMGPGLPIKGKRLTRSEIAIRPKSRSYDTCDKYEVALIAPPLTFNSLNANTVFGGDSLALVVCKWDVHMPRLFHKGFPREPRDCHRSSLRGNSRCRK